MDKKMTRRMARGMRVVCSAVLLMADLGVFGTGRKITYLAVRFSDYSVALKLLWVRAGKGYVTSAFEHEITTFEGGISFQVTSFRTFG
jgi:hypothetical protein